jgi:hypothetical protein
VPLTEEHAKEGLSAAHILAVAAAARVNVRPPAQHDYGIDGWFESVRILPSGKRAPGPFPLPYQAKASEKWTQTDDHMVYALQC